MFADERKPGIAEAMARCLSATEQAYHNCWNPVEPTSFFIQMRAAKNRKLWQIAGVTLLLVVVAATFLALKLRHAMAPGMVQDIRAGIAARGIPEADERVERYLELRYGPLSDPANRRQAFLAFFDTDHIKALQLIVRHSPEDQRQANVQAMARWIEGYRNSLPEEERVVLNDRFQTPEGRAMLRGATAQYNSQDVRYRGMTAPVISQLLNTISTIQTP